MPGLALGDQVAHGSGDVLDRHVGIDPVLVQEVDRLDAQALQRAIHGPANMLRAAADPMVLARLGIDVEAELGGDHHRVADRAERFADHLLVGEGPVDLRRVEEGHPALHGGADQGDTLVLGQFGRVAEADAHAA